MTDLEINTNTAPDNNPVHEAVQFYWGERCPEHEDGCPVCEAWRQYDNMFNHAEDARVTQIIAKEGLLQDEAEGYEPQRLSRWFASRADARHVVRKHHTNEWAWHEAKAQEHNQLENENDCNH